MIVNLGPFQYRASWSKKEWLRYCPDPDVLYGYTHHRRELILVQPDTSATMRKTVLLHEVMHAAAFTAGHIDSRKRSEEAWVVMVAPLLLDALRRSPDLTAYLLDDTAA